ncbi:tRNA dihydrouridine synthase DusB [Rhodospirillum rubrum]|uniref:tRNA dihydrouridine synthase DusB n=1 Tax=Rhodospirillum rubrum TaxID=1085 RepID=UPI0019044BEF|nr:tRNA dihydrouridine synthase DusB [Rhodospirillum rubrum]MBK1664752.1 tRNA dihydrouridine synthase DusB [Rhodospirillum rubrum]MBK1676412.1 tRNA dihydrouridine synthase DusB [Rhodospirillum rubrum]
MTPSPAFPVSDPLIMLAPMAGVTDSPFRRLAHDYGCPLSWTEMVASRELLRERGRGVDPRLGSGAEAGRAGSFAVQLAGCDPLIMAEAARRVEGAGAELIDINMGCPVRKVVGGLGGSALMRDLPLAARILEAVVGAVDVPVSLKMRLGWDDASRNAVDLARLAERAGISRLTVHGRTRAQMYDGRADWPAIGLVKRAVSLPVIANGDVTSLSEAREILAVTGADGVMIGRAALGAPWLPGAIARAIAAGTPETPPPALAERAAVIAAHLEGLLACHGLERGLKTSRKHMGWYALAMPQGADFRAAYMAAADAGAARRVLSHFTALWQSAPPSASQESRQRAVLKNPTPEDTSPDRPREEAA